MEDLPLTTEQQSSNKQIQEDDDQTWILDSLVGFLKSPLWSSSLNDFTDHNSVVFDPDDIEDDKGQVQRRPEYETVFRQYRSLVDCLIGSHMTELGIDEEQFAKACQMAEGMLATKLKRILFEELWAAENYEIFVRLMAKRNVELQLEALEMLVRKYGLVYDVFVPDGTSPKNFLSEEHILREAIVRSLDDMALEKQEQDKLTKDDEEQHSLSLSSFRRPIRTNIEVDIEYKPKDSDQIQIKKYEDQNKLIDEIEETNQETVQKDAARLVEVKHKFDQKMEEALQSALINDNNEDFEEHLTEERTLIDDKLPDVSKNLIQELETSETSKTQQSKDQKNISDHEWNEKDRRVSIEDIHKRAKYLRAQRDKILQQRQKERTERISKYLIKEKQNDSLSSKRPRTALKSSEGSQSTEIKSTNKEQVLAFRKTLAARLKAEVVLGGQQQQK